MTDYIDIVFDGPPSHESGRFVEVEDRFGRSINFGTWVEREDGYWVLRIEDKFDTILGLLEANVKLLSKIEARIPHNTDREHS